MRVAPPAPTSSSSSEQQLIVIAFDGEWSALPRPSTPATCSFVRAPPHYCVLVLVIRRRLVDRLYFAITDCPMPASPELHHQNAERTLCTRRNRRLCGMCKLEQLCHAMESATCSALRPTAMIMLDDCKQQQSSIQGCGASKAIETARICRIMCRLWAGDEVSPLMKQDKTTASKWSAHDCAAKDNAQSQCALQPVRPLCRYLGEGHSTTLGSVDQQQHRH